MIIREVRGKIVEPINVILYAYKYCKTIGKPDNSVVAKYVIQQLRYQILTTQWLKNINYQTRTNN